MWLDLRQLIAVPAQLLCPPPLPHTCRPQIQVNFDSIIGVPICSEAGDRRLSGLRFSHVISRKLFDRRPAPVEIAVQASLWWLA